MQVRYWDAKHMPKPTNIANRPTEDCLVIAME